MKCENCDKEFYNKPVAVPNSLRYSIILQFSVKNDQTVNIIRKSVAGKRCCRTQFTMKSVMSRCFQYFLN